MLYLPNLADNGVVRYKVFLENRNMRHF